MTNPAASPDDLNSRMRQIWEEVLKAPIGADETFFALGGDSLSATRIVTRVRERLGISLSVLDVFDAPTLSEFSALARSVPIPVD
ncbi:MULTISPECIES: phosphopantetheine-binding protein [Thermomonosporaceae]|uniref:phosphopantetheine-binding protein n=1 Tax=Thermomonosporaceae TaxID=2012 RepID=UPI00255AFB49|nr:MULTISPECIES: phosphopantetheine-binding protein [Thermomonosporaceae]MDL4775354.1 phosphopantetheine-binding protein [Actinomadura xylanilytica]